VPRRCWLLSVPRCGNAARNRAARRVRAYGKEISTIPSQTPILPFEAPTQSLRRGGSIPILQSAIVSALSRTAGNILPGGRSPILPTWLAASRAFPDGAARGTAILAGLEALRGKLAGCAAKCRSRARDPARQS